jgi:hypothetical protein
MTWTRGSLSKGRFNPHWSKLETQVGTVLSFERKNQTKAQVCVLLIDNSQKIIQQIDQPSTKLSVHDHAEE